MALSLVTAPATEPITVAEAKLHLRVDGADEDLLIQSLIAAARAYAEAFTHRALITQTWDLKLGAFPCGDIWLPKPPVSSVTSISYVDANGDTQTWASSNYTADLPSGPEARMGRITPAYSVSYPTTRDVVNAVTVRFVCGYGAASAVPDAIRHAMRMMVAHWYEQREPVNIGNITTVLPMTVESLLWPYKAF